MSKYFFQNRGDNCYTIEYWKQYMKDNGISEMAVYEAKRDVGSGYFYCDKLEEVGESGEGCGKSCKYYQPRNKKNGICKHAKPTYEQTDKVKILKL